MPRAAESLSSEQRAAAEAAKVGLIVKYVSGRVVNRNERPGYSSTIKHNFAVFTTPAPRENLAKSGHKLDVDDCVGAFNAPEDMEGRYVREFLGRCACT